jgi:2-amino-4-hydroxy-6-hydroxymethyldihydropteridine diphosphokinase
MTIRYHLALGSNQGNRLSNLIAGLTLLARHGTVIRRSSVYITRPVDVPLPCANFFNMVCVYESDLSPQRLLCLCQAIEKRCGRLANSHNLPRPLDIDILLAGETRIKTPELTLPHPRIGERPFVLRPLLEIDANIYDPDQKKPYRVLYPHRPGSGICGRFRLHDQGVARL